MPFFAPVSAQFSNAVLVAILPYFSEFAAKLDLPIPRPIAAEQVSHFTCDPRETKIGGWVQLTNGYMLWFENGIVNEFRSPECYSALQDAHDIPKFYGKVNMGRKRAETLAVQSLKRIGYAIETCFVDPEPKVTEPERIEGNIVPRYRFQWNDPSSGNTSIDIEVNAETKRIEMVALSSRHFWREPPVVAGYDHNRARNRSERTPQDIPLTQSNVAVLTEKVFPEIVRLIERVGWPILTPVTTNHIQELTYQRETQELYLRLRNGYRFMFANGYLQSAHAPTCFFSPRPGLKIQDVIGKRKINEATAVKVARQTLNQLGYSGPALGMDQNPAIRKPFTTNLSIPRYLIVWRQNPEGILESAAEIEINAENQHVTSIYIYDSERNREMPEISLATDAAKAKMFNRADAEEVTLEDAKKMFERTRQSNKNAPTNKPPNPFE